MSVLSAKISVKKKLAPLPKRVEGLDLKERNSYDDTAEFSDDVLDKVFSSNFGQLGNQENNKSQSFIDLDDWIPSVASKSDTVNLEEVNRVTSKEVKKTPPAIGVTLNIRKGLFSSREYEVDSTLNLRFGLRHVAATELKKMASSSQKIDLLDALNYSSKDSWFTYGVVTDYCEFKGSSGARVDLTDLSSEPYILRITLFKTAFSEIGKIPVGTIVCVKNPVKAKQYKGKDGLIANDSDQLLLAGTSRDYGLCNGRTKSGASCRAVVNLDICRYCRFHAVSEYKQQRMAKDIRAAAAGVGFSTAKKSPGGLWNANAKIGPSLTPALANKSKLKKDKDILAKLSEGESNVSNAPREACSLPSTPTTVKRKFDSPTAPSEVWSLPSTPTTVKRKFDSPNAPSEVRSSPSTPTIVKRKLESPCRSSSSQKMSAAKRRALEYVREKGTLEVDKPKPCLGHIEEKKSSPKGITAEFLAVMKEKPRDSALLKHAEAVEQDKRFERLKVVEEIGEKLAATHEVPVRALRCLVCQKNYHALPLQCAMNKHSCKVVTGTKRFFECGNCKNRTTTLEIFPVTECGKCGAVKWMKSGVAPDRVCSISQPLSVRGLEEKFIGSVAQDPNLNLLVPDQS